VQENRRPYTLLFSTDLHPAGLSKTLPTLRKTTEDHPLIHFTVVTVKDESPFGSPRHCQCDCATLTMANLLIMYSRTELLSWSLLVEVRLLVATVFQRAEVATECSLVVSYTLAYNAMQCNRMLWFYTCVTMGDVRFFLKTQDWPIYLWSCPLKCCDEHRTHFFLTFPDDALQLEASSKWGPKATCLHNCQHLAADSKLITDPFLVV
jgi:hypothetical protein